MFVIFVGTFVNGDICALAVDKPSFQPVIDIDRVECKDDLFPRSLASQTDIKLVEVRFADLGCFLDPNVCQFAVGECDGLQFLNVIQTGEDDLVLVEGDAHIGRIHFNECAQVHLLPVLVLQFHGIYDLFQQGEGRIPVRFACITDYKEIHLLC